MPLAAKRKRTSAAASEAAASTSSNAFNTSPALTPASTSRHLPRGTLHPSPLDMRSPTSSLDRYTDALDWAAAKKFENLNAEGYQMWSSLIARWRDKCQTEKDRALASFDSQLTEYDQMLGKLRTLEQPAAHPRSASVLQEVSAPAQLTTSPTTRLLDATGQRHASKPTACTSCPNCRIQADQVLALKAQVEAHEKERQSWKAFKTWWLDSLTKKEKKRGRDIRLRRHEPPSSAATTELIAGEARNVAPREREAEREDRTLQAVVARLDEGTRAVWANAGIIAPLNNDSSTCRAREGEEVTGESAGQQSEQTLPLQLHAVLPSAPQPSLQHQVVPAPRTPRTPVGAAAATTLTSTNIAAPATAAATASTSPSARRPRAAGTTSTPTTRTPAAHRDIGHVDSTPIRSRLARRTMLAHDCPDCALFYSHFNDLPTAAGGAGAGERQGDRERTACSRHRTTYQRATTPEGYWNIGFPTTQEADEMNEAARRKRAQQ